VAIDSGYWAKFWEDKGDPLHSSSDAAFYDQMAREMMVLLGDQPFGSVLELACGNGVFYERLGFNRGQYIGIDYSAKMLEVFKAAHPDVQLSNEDARTFVPPQPVDLIFSSGYVQYISVADMERHLKLSVKSLNPGGRIVHIAVPWDVMRWVFYSAMTTKTPTPRLRALVSYILARTGIRPSLGHWHSIATFRHLAANAGLDATFYGSLFYPYRFNVVMVKRDR
jgi:trans-aconitate methyltransferase